MLAFILGKHCLEDRTMALGLAILVLGFWADSGEFNVITLGENCKLFGVEFTTRINNNLTGGTSPCKPHVNHELYDGCR